MLPETKNFLRFCLNPLDALKTFLFFLGRFFFSLQYRFHPPTAYYPPSVSLACYRALERLRSIRDPQVQEAKTNEILSDSLSGRGRLKLAAGFLEYNSQPNWKVSFDDPEQLMSLHRWGWLLYAGSPADSEVSLERGLHLMRSWLSVMG